MRIFKKTIKYILTIIITVLIIAYLLINLLSSTILNESYILSKLEETGYYDKIYDYVLSNFENYIHQSGFDEKVLDNIITKEKVRNDTRAIISNIFNGIAEDIEVKDIEEKLNENINNQISGMTLTEVQKQSIELFVKTICDEYTTTISHFKYETHINTAYSKIMEYLELGSKIILIIAGMSVISLILLNRKIIYRTFMYLGTSLLSSGAFFVIVNIYINAKVKVQNILILNDVISESLRNLMGDILNMELKYGVILLVLGIMFTLISNGVHNRRKFEYEKIKGFDN